MPIRGPILYENRNIRNEVWVWNLYIKSKILKWLEGVLVDAMLITMLMLMLINANYNGNRYANILH